MTAEMVEQHFAQFERRLLQDVMQEATAAYWLHRAGTFEAAKPRPGEHYGQATRAELSAAWNRCDSIARACRHKATMALIEDVPEVAAVLEEVA